VTTIRDRTSTAVDALVEYLRDNLDTHLGAINTDLASDGRGYRLPTGLSDSQIDRSPQGARLPEATPAVVVESGEPRLRYVSGGLIGERRLPLTVFVYLSVGDVEFTSDEHTHSDEALLNNALDDFIEAVHRCLQAAGPTLNADAGVFHMANDDGFSAGRRLYRVAGRRAVALQGRARVTLLQRVQMVSPQ
jgi:hypothetical protein